MQIWEGHALFCIFQKKNDARGILLGKKSSHRLAFEWMIHRRFWISFVSTYDYATVTVSGSFYFSHSSFQNSTKQALSSWKKNRQNDWRVSGTDVWGNGSVIGHGKVIYGTSGRFEIRWEWLVFGHFRSHEQWVGRCLRRAEAMPLGGKPRGIVV